MDSFLVTLDGTHGSLKSIRYLNRILKGAKHIRLVLFHVIPTTSPNLLKKEEVQRIEKIHAEQAHLKGYFWTREDEDRMNLAFQEARQLLLEGGFSNAQVTTRFSVQSAEVAQVILEEGKRLECSTIVIGRRGLSRVKELFLGSVSKTVTKLARSMTVWVVDD